MATWYSKPYKNRKLLQSAIKSIRIYGVGITSSNHSGAKASSIKKFFIGTIYEATMILKRKTSQSPKSIMQSQHNLGSVIANVDSSDSKSKSTPVWPYSSDVYAKERKIRIQSSHRDYHHCHQLRIHQRHRH